MTRNRFTTLLLTGLITSLMAGCSGDDEYLFEHGPAGPNTGKTLKNLPEGLLPDKSNSNHTGDTLEPK